MSLEEPDVRELASGDPRGFLSGFPQGAVIDEAQRCPELFSYIQTRVDRERRMGQYVLTGSQHFGLLSGVTQSLAGRAGILHLLPFSLAELRGAGLELPELAALLFKGLYPPLYDRPLRPDKWYADYALTYLERDLRQMLMIRDLTAFQRFLRMCAARTGQLLNLSGLASDCGISHNTARSWLSVLEASYLVFLLPPHTRNFGKRLVKSPKLYFLDPGLAAWLLNVQDPDHLSIHPQRGALFETLIVGELLKARFNRGLASNLFFWRDNTGNEIDLLIDRGRTLTAVELKSGQTVASDFTAGLERWRRTSAARGTSYLVYGGSASAATGDTRILPWSGMGELLEALG